MSRWIGRQAEADKGKVYESYGNLPRAAGPTSWQAPLLCRRMRSRRVTVRRSHGLGFGVGLVQVDSP